jgi:hypothetical protein
MKPFMPEKETELFMRCLKSKPNLRYYEFGSGGSTYVACEAKNVSQIWSQESDTAFFKNMNKNPVIHTASKLTYALTEVGCQDNWGYPAIGTLKEQWLPYFRTIRTVEHIPDFILIDGRFRVACALNAWFKANTETLVLFDDFTNRPHYHDVLKYYKIVETVGRMVLLKKYIDVTMDEKDVEIYESDPR